MEEGQKSLRESLQELTEKINSLEVKKEKKNLFRDVPAWGYIVGLALGGFGLFITWIFMKDIIVSSIVGVLLLAITLFVSTTMGKFPPWSAGKLGKQKKRKGYVVFMNIGLNRAITFIKAPLDEGVAIVNGTPHIISADDILLWKNKIPIVIQPQWSERPFSPKDHYDKTVEDNAESKGWRTLMNYIYKNQIQPEKKKMSIGLWIILGIVVIGAGWYLMTGGKF